jgi:transcriptional regulator with XRE-family HTH domain
MDIDRGKRLCDLMDVESVSNLELAKLAGVSSSTVSMWRRGAEIKNRYLGRLAARLNTSTDYLLTGVDKPDSLESQLLKGFRSLPIKNRKAILTLIETLVT